MRCFLAIELNEEVKNELIKIQEEIKPFLDAKFVELGNLHLTLKFFGEVDEKDFREIQEALKEIKFPKFSVSLGKIGFFPNENLAKVLWISLESEEILELSGKIDTSLINFKDKDFESHVTLARIKNISNKEEFLKKIKDFKIKPISFNVRDFVLKKSTLTAKGPIYEDVERFELI